MAKINKLYYKNKDGEFKPYYSSTLRRKSQDELEHIRELYKPFYFTPYESEPYFTIDSVRKNFRLFPTHKHYGVYTSSEESATHKYCVHEISKLNTLQIKLKNEIPNYPKGSIVNFEFNYALPEFEIKMGDEVVVRPDVVLFLKAPADLAIYFKRILFVEVVVTHNIDEKIKIYDKARIPVLRIKANKKWGKKPEYEMSETKKEELQRWIRNSFKNTYSADLLLPTEHQIILENKVIENAEIEKETLKKQIKNTLNAAKLQKQESESLQRNNSKLSENLNIEIQRYKEIKLLNQNTNQKLINEKRKNKRLVKTLYFFIVLIVVLVLTNKYL